MSVLGASSFINIFICTMIIAGGAGIAGFEFITLTKLRQIYKSFEKVVIREQTKDADGEWMDMDGNVGMSTTVNVRYDRGELERSRGLFSVAYANYVTCGQLTSLLPLLGIFGTVAGLIMSSGTTDMGQMVAGLGTAMWTTLLGLVFSIVLKAFDAVLLGRLVNLIDAKFSEADTIITRQTLQAEVRRERTQLFETVRPQGGPQSEQMPVRAMKPQQDGQQPEQVPVRGVKPPKGGPQPEQVPVRAMKPPQDGQQPEQVPAGAVKQSQGGPQPKQAPAKGVKQQPKEGLQPQDVAEETAEKSGREPTRVTKVQKKTQ